MSTCSPGQGDDRAGLDLEQVGERAWFVTVDGRVSPARLAEHARSVLEGLVEAIPAHETLLLEWDSDPIPSRGEVLDALIAAGDRDASAGSDEEIEVPVTYDGEDLEAVAEASGLSPEAVVRLHSSSVYTAAFCGFAPGFAYLTGLPRELQLPRRDDPRTRVPRGSVAIAGEYSGIYPSASPGGWHLIGKTGLRLFEPGSSRPALIEPGMRVRFRA